jgi:hypothetical protein
MRPLTIMWRIHSVVTIALSMFKIALQDCGLLNVIDHGSTRFFSASKNEKAPVSVPSLAQVPAGWGLYKDLPSYPNFEGMAGLLSEGIATWLGSPSGWEEGDGALVVNNGDGTYTVTNARLMESITINHPIPLASAAVW